MATINPSGTLATQTVNVGASIAYVILNTSDVAVDLIATANTAGGNLQWRDFETTDHTGNRFFHDNTGSGKLNLQANQGVEIQLVNIGSANSAATLSLVDRRGRQPNATVLVALRGSVTGDDITP